MAAGSSRLASLDVLRGLVIVLMALDHTRDFFGAGGFGATNPVTTSPALFLTRWITHLCAPTFVLLAGLGAALALERGQSRWQSARFLILRGLVLIVLELTLVKFGWSLNWNYQFVMLQVIWAIGWSMIVLGLLIWMPGPVLGLLGLLIISTHNLADGVPSKDVLPAAPWLWDLLHRSTFVPLGQIPVISSLVPDASKRVAFNLYPVLPWVGVMLVGFALGAVYRLEPRRRQWGLLALGLLLVAAFLALRWPNWYGEPLPWRAQAEAWRTVASFLNCTKYPPSLQFLLMTLGPALTLLAAFEFHTGYLGRFLAVFGRAPLFFYLVHLPVLHAGARLVANWPDYTVLWASRPRMPRWELSGVYLAWVVAILVLFFPSLWFGWLKRRFGGLLRYL